MQSPEDLENTPLNTSEISTGLKVSKFQNEFVKSSFLPKYSRNTKIRKTLMSQHLSKFDRSVCQFFGSVYSGCFLSKNC